MQACVWQLTKMHLKPVRQGAQKLDFDRQANESGHTAVWDSRCELHRHCALLITHLLGDKNVTEKQRERILYTFH